MLKGAALLSAGQLGSHLLSLLRTIIVVRELSKEDYAIAVMIALVVAAIELFSELAVDRLLVQDKAGDEPRSQATAHALQAFRGLAGAAAMVLIAWPVCASIQATHALWAFLLLAVVPLARGLMHLDFRRLERHRRFRASLAVEFVPQLVATFAAWPILWATGDYSAMLWITMTHTASMLVVSHAVAQRRYAWGWDRSFVASAWAFGLPLLANGALLFGINQADKLVVGTWFGKEALADFGLAFVLASMPTAIFARAATSVLLGFLSSKQSDKDGFASRSAITLDACSLATSAMGIGMILLGPAVILVLFGARYASAVDLFVILALACGLRNLRVGPTLIAMARADTVSPLKANLVRVLALPVILGLATAGAELWSIALVHVLAELVASVTLIGLIHRRLGIAHASLVRPVGLAVIALLVGAGAWLALSNIVGHWALLPRVGIETLVACTLVAATASLAIAVSFPLRSELALAGPWLRRTLRPA